MSVPRCALNSRDREILMFLWRWKIATTATLQHRFFSQASSRVAYNRMQKLKAAGYIVVRADESLRNHFWTLGKKGYQIIRDELPELREEGYLSESPRHDLLVNAMHIGEWLVIAPEHARLYTEQQLRRVAVSARPAWIPRSDHHRPDGYWGVREETSIRVTALEVELHQKRRDFYESIAHFYQDETRIGNVLWLVANRGLAKSIYSILSETGPTRSHIHDFVDLHGFEASGWQAKVILGTHTGKPLGMLIDKKWRLGNPSVNLPRSVLLNGRKSFFVSRTSSARVTPTLYQLAPAIRRNATSALSPAESPAPLCPALPPSPSAKRLPSNSSAEEVVL